MLKEKRVISHARNDSSIDRVLGKNGKKYSVEDALDKKIDWVQIDIGFLTESEKQTVLQTCGYCVINGSHTVMGEILGVNSKPIIGIPVYDEHSNNLKWAEEKNLGILAKKKDQVISGIKKIKKNMNIFQENLEDFSKNFVSNGGETTAKIVNDELDKKT
jgi:UDP:flavonoid glycosyltransferase YjiC (YdhE family)